MEILAIVPHTVRKYAERSKICVFGDEADFVPYLLEGRVKVRPEGDFCYEIEPGDALAKFPLSSGATYASTITALSDVEILCFPLDVIKFWGVNSTLSD